MSHATQARGGALLYVALALVLGVAVGAWLVVHLVIEPRHERARLEAEQAAARIATAKDQAELTRQIEELQRRLSDAADGGGEPCRLPESAFGQPASTLASSSATVANPSKQCQPGNPLCEP